jgi:AraC-like DNA-binding protein
MTFTEYLSRVRIEKAKSLLGNASARITEAASEAGFESIPHFNRVFRKYAGVCPTQYRASLRKWEFDATIRMSIQVPDSDVSFCKEKANRRVARVEESEL